MSESWENPVTVVPQENLIPVSDHLSKMFDIPPSRMFLINKSLAVYKNRRPDSPMFDASQGDGGASLPGVPEELLIQALEIQRRHGSAYDMPYGTDEFRKVVVEKYWKLDAASGLGPGNVLATVGGRDALMKAYMAMLALGHGRAGDLLVVGRVPWISYNWGPYGIGANVLLAPGRPEEGWAYTEDGLKACADVLAHVDVGQLRDGVGLLGEAGAHGEQPRSGVVAREPLERLESVEDFAALPAAHLALAQVQLVGSHAEARAAVLAGRDEHRYGPARRVPARQTQSPSVPAEVISNQGE